MPRLEMVAVLVRRIGGRGALDNVTEVLAARARVDTQVASLAARVGRAA